MTPALEARRISKSYGAIHALKCADFVLQGGEIHALIGANGAGKSTLCKIIAGIEQPSSGSLILDGEPVAFASVRDAVAHGVDIIHQELSIFPDLSVAENIFVGRELANCFGLVDKRAQIEASRKVLARLGQPIDPTVLAGNLPVGLQQIVEIAKALTHNARILMMDEPTSALSRSEIPLLFEVIRSLAADGVAIVYISHRLDELLAISDRITVLRDGEVVARAACCDVNPAWIVEKMTGRTSTHVGPAQETQSGTTLLSLRNLSLPLRTGRVALDGINLDVRAGEVIGLFGLMGAGRTELFETLIGLHRDTSGRIELNGVELGPLNVADRVKAGLALLPEDRQRDGLIPNLSILHNMTLSSLEAMGAGWVKPALERRSAVSMVETLGIKIGALNHPVQSLSGGNQQKLVLARCLMSGPKLLLLDEPTRGVDVAAKAEILAEMRMLAKRGVGVVFASSDASEILSASTRIVVMSRGRIALETTPQAANDALLAEAAAVDTEAPILELSA